MWVKHSEGTGSSTPDADRVATLQNNTSLRQRVGGAEDHDRENRRAGRESELEGSRLERSQLAVHRPRALGEHHDRAALADRRLARLHHLHDALDLGDQMAPGNHPGGAVGAREVVDGQHGRDHQGKVGARHRVAAIVVVENLRPLTWLERDGRGFRQLDVVVEMCFHRGDNETVGHQWVEDP